MGTQVVGQFFDIEIDHARGHLAGEFGLVGNLLILNGKAGNVYGEVTESGSVPQSMGAVAMGSSWTIHNMGGAVGLALGLVCYQLAAESRLLSDLATLNIPSGPWTTAMVNDPDGALSLLLEYSNMDTASALAIFQKSFLAGYKAAMTLLALVSLLLLGVLIPLLERQRNRSEPS